MTTQSTEIDPPFFESLYMMSPTGTGGLNTAHKLLRSEVNLRPTVSRPVCLGVGLLSGAHDQSFVFCLTTAGFLMCGTLSDERTGL
jgi:hypothetical protein